MAMAEKIWDMAWAGAQDAAMRAGAWATSHKLRTLAGMVLGLMLIGMASCATQSPRADRDWYPYLARDVHVAREGDAVRIAPVTDWRYGADGPTREIYAEAAFDIGALQRVWFVLEPQPGSDLAAHTFLLFEFPDDRLLGVTVEARREVGEPYDAVRGAFNTFELAYLWGSARDLLTRRAVMLRHDVFIYPVVLTEAQKRDLLTRIVSASEALEARPRFYNTLTSNCTNELAKATNLHWAPPFVLTGLADEHLFERDLIPGESFEDAHARSDMAGFVTQWNVLNRGEGEFDRDLLAELRARWGG